jgi:DTW domain-containing protein YfiP
MRNLFLKSLPKSFSEEDIGRLAAALGATVTSAMVWKDKRGKSRGVALAEFETEEQADAVKAGLKQRMLRRPGEGEAAAGAGGVCFEIGEGGSAWVLCQADEGDRNALIVEAAFREASHQKDRDSAPRQPRVKEDPREKQKRCELLRKERKAAKLAELEADVPPEERDNLLTLEKVRRMRALMGTEIGQRCSVCWLLHPQCICAPPTPSEILANFRHRTIVWLHCKEFGRLSNTGGLISVAFPSPQTHVLVSGMQEDEKAFLAELERDPEATFVLFPSEDSITAQEFMTLVEQAPEHDQARAEKAEEAAAPASAPGERVYTIILVDGTWQQARRLAAKIPPHIKRVRLMPREAIDPVYKSPMRSQATPDRVCSLSAYVLLLQELQTPPHVCDYLFHLLHKKSDIVLNTSGKAWKQTGESPPCAHSLVNHSLRPELRQKLSVRVQG